VIGGALQETEIGRVVAQKWSGDESCGRGSHPGALFAVNWGITAGARCQQLRNGGRHHSVLVCMIDVAPPPKITISGGKKFTSNVWISISETPAQHSITPLRMG